MNRTQKRRIGGEKGFVSTRVGVLPFVIVDVIARPIATAQRRPEAMREPIVQATIVELLEIVGDLCTVAGALVISGRGDRAETLLEQAAELLAHRADLLGLPRIQTEADRPGVEVEARTASSVSRWTN